MSGLVGVWELAEGVWGECGGGGGVCGKMGGEWGEWGNSEFVRSGVEVGEGIILSCQENIKT